MTRIRTNPARPVAVRGRLRGRPFQRTFRSYSALERWLDRNEDVTVTAVTDRGPDND